MNFIAASLLFHAKEYVAYELFCIIMERYLGEIYTDLLKQLTLKSQHISDLLDNHKELPRLAKIMVMGLIRKTTK